jgi:SAM-dependent methyltransferase
VERYWQNWDEGDTAVVIDQYWLQSSGEVSSRSIIATDIRETIGRLQPIFEVGCGTGLMAAALLQHGATDETLYEGIDVSESMLAIARDRLPQIEFVAADIFDLSKFPPRDNVVCLHVLQHLPYYSDALDQLLGMALKHLYIVTWFNETEDDEIGMSRDSDAIPIFYTNAYALPKFLASLKGRRADRHRDAVITSRHLIGRSHAVSVRFI